MPTERLSPDAILAASNLSGPVAAIQDDPDTPDGSWLTAVAIEDVSLRVSFPTASGDLVPGFGAQALRLLFRKDAAGGNDPTLNIDLYENGILMTNLVAGYPVTSETGQVPEFLWNAAGFSAADGSGFELLITGARSGGSPSKRRTIEIGAIEWNAQYQSTTRSGAILASDVADVAALAGQAWSTGSLSAGDAPDVAGLTGNLPALASLAATDATDGAGLSGFVTDPAATGSATAFEAFDVAAVSAFSVSRASALIIEANDGLTVDGTVNVAGALSANEASDQFAGIASVQFAAITGTGLMREPVDLISVAGRSGSAGIVLAGPAPDAASISMRSLTRGDGLSFEQLDTANLGAGISGSGNLASTETADAAGFTGAGAQVDMSMSATDPVDRSGLLARLIANAALFGIESGDTSKIDGATSAPALVNATDPVDTASFAAATLGVSAVLSVSEGNDDASVSVWLAASGAWVSSDGSDIAALAGWNDAAFSQLIVENTSTGSASWTQAAGCSSQRRIIT